MECVALVFKLRSDAACNRSFQRAKKISRELEKLHRDINFNMLARPPRGDRVENDQVRRVPRCFAKCKWRLFLVSFLVRSCC